jgi:hypothetical protein
VWADNIILSDQKSSDHSVSIARKYDKVTIIENTSCNDFNEFQIRNPLFNEARNIEGPKIFISLDADEILTPNWDSLEWQTIRKAKPGTIFGFPLINILSNNTYWELGHIMCGYVDDGASYESGLIHVPRSIQPAGHDVIMMNDIKIIHYHFMDWDRMMMKHRWYQCFELINKVNKPIDIFRRYHYMFALPQDNMKIIPEWWKTGYAKNNIDITSITKQSNLLWRKRIVNYLDTYDAKYFRHLDIWDINWCEAAEAEHCEHYTSFSDPRHFWEKAVNRYLRRSQARKDTDFVRFIDKILRLIYR